MQVTQAVEGGGGAPAGGMLPLGMSEVPSREKFGSQVLWNVELWAL